MIFYLCCEFIFDKQTHGRNLVNYFCNIFFLSFSCILEFFFYVLRSMCTFAGLASCVSFFASTFQYLHALWDCFFSSSSVHMDTPCRCVQSKFQSLIRNSFGAALV